MSDVSRRAQRPAQRARRELRGEPPGRSRNPVIKVADLAWLEFEKPDLDRAETFARAFGLRRPSTAAPTELQLRGTDAGAPCVCLVRRGPRTRFLGVAFRAQDEVDVLRLADKTNAPTRALPESSRRRGRRPHRSSGTPVKVVAGIHDLPELPGQPPHVFNFGHKLPRTNTTQRPPRAPRRRSSV